MKIFVDADACPVVRQIEAIARKYKVPVTLLCDTNHILTSDYSEVKVPMLSTSRSSTFATKAMSS